MSLFTILHGLVYCMSHVFSIVCLIPRRWGSVLDVPYLLDIKRSIASQGTIAGVGFVHMYAVYDVRCYVYSLIRYSMSDSSHHILLCLGWGKDMALSLLRFLTSPLA